MDGVHTRGRPTALAGFNPPTVAIGLCHSASRPEGKKDTLRNIEQTGYEPLRRQGLPPAPLPPPTLNKMSFPRINYESMTCIH